MSVAFGSRLMRVAGLGAIVLVIGCSRASLLGGPGPEAAHHESPAQLERLAVLEPGKKYDSKDKCRQQLMTLAQVSSPDQLIRISELEVRAYHVAGAGAGAVHHEYSCVDKQLMTRSWTGKGPIMPAPHDATDLAPEVH